MANKTYYELSVFSSHFEILSDLAFELGISAIEQIQNGFIIRDENPLDIIELGLKTFAKKANIDITTTITQKQNSDWIKAYQDGVKPVKCGRFYIRPSWCESKDELEIIIDPALAFGSGHHESTASCLELISKYANNFKGKDALDLGCGSGILSIALAKLGLSVDALDTDEQAISASLSNASKNAINLHSALVASIDKINAKYDVICANIIADVILALSKDLKSHLKDGGYLIISGILNRYKERILESFNDLKCLENLSKNEWESFIFQKV